MLNIIAKRNKKEKKSKTTMGKRLTALTPKPMPPKKLAAIQAKTFLRLSEVKDSQRARQLAEKNVKRLIQTRIKTGKPYNPQKMVNILEQLRIMQSKGTKLPINKLNAYIAEWAIQAQKQELVTRQGADAIFNKLRQIEKEQI